jgi:deoxycytidylate deaminase
MMEHSLPPTSYYTSKDDIPPKITTDKQRYFLDRAARMAMKSTMTQKHGCILVVNGEILSEGFNHHFTHMCHKFSIHAEADALHKAKRYKHILGDAELYVVRIATGKFDNCLKYSKPCCGCQEVILKYGIKKVYYSTNTEYEMLWKNIYVR